MNTKENDELSQEEVPFPQADSFTKVLGALELINSDINTANLIAEEFDFDSRQGKYYIDALRYLNLVKKSNKVGEYELAPLGFTACKIDSKTRNKKIIEEMLKHKPFYETYKYYLEAGIMPNKEYIKDIIRQVIPELSEETINRRASTVRGWIQWIVGCQI